MRGRMGERECVDGDCLQRACVSALLLGSVWLGTCYNEEIERPNAISVSVLHALSNSVTVVRRWRLKSSVEITLNAT